MWKVTMIGACSASGSSVLEAELAHAVDQDLAVPR